MFIKLSDTRIESFVGDVLPLMLISDGDISRADIVWSVSGDAVGIRGFEAEDGGFNHGVLITLLHAGEAAVCAEYAGEKYCAAVTVREMKRAESGRLNYYIGDFHDHTSMIHNKAEFVKRTSEFQEDYIRFLKDENLIDFSVISDHGDVINAWEFFRGFMEAERAKPMDTVIFPGCESEVTFIEKDRYGFPRKNSGEIVTVNADNFAAVRTWEEFYEKFSTSPFAVCALAHPQIIGWDSNGVWNFNLEKNGTPKLRSLVRLVEMGDGTARASNIINEHIYSVALDNGFKVSCSCSSDNHERPWGYYGFPGKTVIMAKERSKEAFLDALLSNRVYASETGNIKLYYTVNGNVAPCTLKLTNKYDFHVEVGCFDNDRADTAPVKCQVISDYGECVKTVEGVDFTSFDFTVQADRARWFYLRLVDAEGRKTWSPPVWCQRKPDPVCTDEYVPIDKSGFYALDLVTGKECPEVINDDPNLPYRSEAGVAEIIIDMKSVKSVAALGHYPPRIFRRAGRNESLDLAECAAEYQVYTGKDGKNYELVAAGGVRVYGGEVMIRFERHEARYVKFRVLSNAGRYSGRKEFDNLALSIGELTVFE